MMRQDYRHEPLEQIVQEIQAIVFFPFKQIIVIYVIHQRLAANLSFNHSIYALLRLQVQICFCN